MIELPDFPIFNQLAGGTEDADGINENKSSNCLATSISMVLKWMSGIDVYADTIKDEMRGEDHIGNLRVNPDGVWYLTQRAGIPVTVYHEQMQHAIRPIVEGALNVGRPVLVLFSSPIGVGGRWVNHFAPIFGYSPQNVLMADPWGGRRVAMDWATFERVYLRWAIVSERGRDPWLEQGTRDIRSYDDIPIGGEAGMEEAGA